PAGDVGNALAGEGREEDSVAGMAAGIDQRRVHGIAANDREEVRGDGPEAAPVAYRAGVSEGGRHLARNRSQASGGFGGYVGVETDALHGCSHHRARPIAWDDVAVRPVCHVVHRRGGEGDRLTTEGFARDSARESIDEWGPGACREHQRGALE